MPSSRVRVALLAVFFAALSCFQSTVHAQDWAATFSPESLSTQFPVKTTRFVVVAAGTNGAEVQPAVAALEAGLRSAQFALVMSDDGLGDVSALDDAAIVAKASSLPIDRVLLVRVFPGPSASAPSAVVVAYNPAGQVQQAFNVTAGVNLLVAPPAAVATSQGADQKAIEAVENITKHSTGGDEARKQYEEQFVWFADRLLVYVNTGAVASGGSVPMQGKYRQKLSWSEFYAAVERPDLSARYRSRRAIKTGLIVAGSVSLAVGLGLLGANVACEAENDDRISSRGLRVNQQDCGGLAAGAVLAGLAGGGALVTGIVLRSQPVRLPEARRLADEHNKRLRQKLGLPDDTQVTLARAHTPSTPRLSLSVAPMLTQSTAGVSAGLRF